MTCLALKPPSVPTEGSKLWARSTSRINPSHHLGYLKILHLPLLCKLLPFSSFSHALRSTCIRGRPAHSSRKVGVR
ncbi:hypothetical protein HBI18_095910 [Parastagonospora nodorum]|nr:hypothetical protein HBI10_196530 [Parastagonospora nodorum]KAH4095364.1 hypothetical protein HBH46_167770 [Parastagonospora nodorum]KAH4801670.1 hypothetical protein HBH61_193730 [Parastagonospora nodorum]KAH4915213.1 hypothetical protein HBH74_146460 [Parastagonospora nodorum]KAH4936226.1 hypothetical protein HBH73_171760 [Parastagonospora nodorum]